MTAPKAPAAECPHPKKSRFATHEAADRAAQAPAALGKRLRSYTCTCGWVHLTKRHADALPPRPGQLAAEIDRLTDVDHTTFVKIARDDALGNATPLTSAALRHPELITRWRAALKALIADIANQFIERIDDRSAEAAAWRRRAQYLQQAVAVRRAEAGVLLAPMHRSVVEHPNLRQAGRAAAGEIAIHRLIDAHRAEFDRNLLEECARLDVEPPPSVVRRHTGTAAADHYPGAEAS